MGITYKEYVWLVKPNDIIETFCGGVYGCPIEYGISNKGFDCLPDVKKCEYCMNQEIPYPVIAEVIRDTYLNPFEKITVGAKYKVTDVDMGAPAFGVMICVAGYNHWANNNNFRYYIDKEEKKVKKEFEKVDLKNGMVVQLRNGERGIVIGKRIVTPHGWYGLNSVCESCDEYSIVKVWRVGDRITGLDSVLTDAEVGELIWERKEEKEISSEEAFAVLKEHYGCDVKIKE